MSLKLMLTRRRLIVVLATVAAVAVGYVGYPRRHLGMAVFASWREDWAAVRRHAERHLAVNSRSGRALLLLARSFREAGDPIAAQRAYDQLSHAGHVPVDDLHWLANHFRRLGQTARHLETRRTIERIAPDHADNLVALAQLYQQSNDQESAAALFERVTRLAPRRADAWEGLAMAHLAFRNPEQAARCLREAVALGGPQTARIRRTLAGMYLSALADVDAAQNQLELALQDQPDDPHAHWLLAECLLQRNPPEVLRARDHAVRANHLDPQNHRALLLLARLGVADGDADAALRYVQQLLRQAPNDTEALHLQRIAQRMQQRRDGGGKVSVKQLFLRQELTVTWRFEELAGPLGLAFHHTSGEDPQRRYYPESLGSGVAIFDYNGDGRTDVYFVSCNFLSPDAAPISTVPRNTLYRSEADGRFRDVTEQSGLGDTGFGHGVAVGDYDNDGLPDVYVTNYGPNRLFRNNGDGTFADVSATAAVDHPGMSTSAAWLDYDEDGDLDLYVCNYADYDVHDPVVCTAPGQGAIYCSPESMPSQPDVLYRNNGDGTFTDVTRAMGIARDQSPGTLGKGLGVVVTDFNGDGHVDLFVANDNTHNFLFTGDGRVLRDVSPSSGAATDKNGAAEACMGVDAGDVNGDGRPDVIVTNDWMEKNTLYRNEGDSLFHDVSDLCGLGYATKRAVGWGTALVDLDRDGDLDNFVTNGHYYDWQVAPFRQTAMLWSNAGDGTFEEVSAKAGPYFQQPVVGRGAAFGDLDNDGDTDIVLNHWNDACALLRNNTQTTGAWLCLELVGVTSNRDAVGTQVEVQIGTRLITAQRKGGGSYLSSNDPRLLIGLGAAEVVDRLWVRWPSGAVQEFAGLPVNRRFQLIEGHAPVAVDVAQ